MIADLPFERVALVILAGGEGVRLGRVIKANLPVGDASLLFRVVRMIPKPVKLLLAVGRHRPSAYELPLPMQMVQDLEGDAGPLAGLRAAAMAISARADIDYLASVAVDTPFLPPDYLQRLLVPMRGNFDASIATADGQSYPTNALYRLTALRESLAKSEEQSRPIGPKALLETLRTCQVDWSCTEGGDPFRSVNTPEDLAAAEARAAKDGTL